MDKPYRDSREQTVGTARPALVPPHLVVAAIKAAAKERVQAYRDAQDTDRLNARDALRELAGKYSIEEVQCWLDECRAERWSAVLYDEGLL